MQRFLLARWSFIAGLVIVLGAFGIDKIRNPLNWTGWMPLPLDGLLGMPVSAWVTIIGVIELGLACILLVPNKRVQQVAAGLISLHLLVVVFQVGWNETGIRDIGLFFAALGLTVML